MYQIRNPLTLPLSPAGRGIRRGGHSDIGVWNLFGIWNL